MYRLQFPDGSVGPWQHFAEPNTHPHPTLRFDERSYRCRFELAIPSLTNWSEVEVAQNLPYTLADRKKFLHHILDTYPPMHDDLCIRKRHLAEGGLGGLVPTTPPEDPVVPRNSNRRFHAASR